MASGEKRTIFSEMSCGAFGGMVAALATHPIDTIKTRMQGSTKRLSTVGCFRATISREGVKGLYRGLTVPLISQPLYVGSSFAGLQGGRYLWDKVGLDPQVSGDAGGEAMLRLAFGGAVGGACCAVAVTPGERLRVVLQMQGTESGGAVRTPLQTVRSIVSVGGYRSLFVGLPATLLREVPGTVLWFGAFDICTARAENRGLPRPLAVLCGAVAAGLAFWLPIIPIDTIKVKQQTTQAGSSMLSITRQILAARGVSGFYVGFAPILTRGLLLDIFQFSGADVLRNNLS